VAGKEFNYELAAQILVDAILSGDRAAAEKYGVATKTVLRHRQRMLLDDKLRALLGKKIEKLDAQLAPERAAFQRDGLAFARAVMARGQVLLAKCSAKQFSELATAVRDVSEAIRNVGELDLAAEVLGVGNRDRQPNHAPETPGGPASEKGDGDRETED
jgi:hypothetical protein